MTLKNNENYNNKKKTYRDQKFYYQPFLKAVQTVRKSWLGPEKKDAISQYCRNQRVGGPLKKNQNTRKWSSTKSTLRNRRIKTYRYKIRSQRIQWSVQDEIFWCNPFSCQNIFAHKYEVWREQKKYYKNEQFKMRNTQKILTRKKANYK